MGQLMRASGTFEVTMAAANGNDGAKGAKPIMLYWDECASGFTFKAGVGGEDVYHIVWETRSATPGTATAYLCIVTHTKSSTKPSADSTHWQRLSNLAMIATDLMLTRQILASEIDVDNLTVKNVNAVSSDGNTTCHIDGATGKLTAKNIDVSGVINCTTLKRKMISQGDITLGAISVRGGGQFILPELDYDQCVEVKVIHIMITKVLLVTYFECANTSVKVFNSNTILDAVYGRASTQCDVTLIGFRYPSSDMYSGVTYWKIIPQDSSDTTTKIEVLTVS